MEVQKSRIPGISLFGDSGGDEGAGAFLKQADGALGLCHRVVDLPAFVVQVPDDGTLLAEGRGSQRNVFHL